MTMSRVEVITSVQRRRRWSRAAKERIVAAALEPGAVASEVARQAGIHTSQLFRWRRQLCGPAEPAPERSAAFTPVMVAPPPESAQAMARQPAEGQAVAGCGSASSAAPGVIEVAFSAGVRVRISGVVDPALVSAAIGALAAARHR
jgi:transposase